MTALGRLLQVDALTWSTIPYQQLRGRAMTVFFAYAMLAWNRFGLLSFTSPRASTRMVLVGIYSWLALALLLWVAGRAAELSFRDAAVSTGIAHVPLVALAFFMAIVAGFARVFGPGLVLAIVVGFAWMPVLLIRALHDMAKWSWPKAALGGTGLQLLWLVTAGRYFYDQVGHLL